MGAGAGALALDRCPISVVGARVLRPRLPSPHLSERCEPMSQHNQCSVPGCPKPRFGHGLCNMHYSRQRSGKPIGGPEPLTQRYEGETCLAPGCDNPRLDRKLCSMHRFRVKRHGSLEPPAPRSGERHPLWVGDAVSYDGMHFRLKAEFGVASTHLCPCGAQAEQWAYQHTDPNERFQAGDGPYSTDPDHYLPMCRPCHRQLDGGAP